MNFVKILFFISSSFFMASCGIPSIKNVDNTNQAQSIIDKKIDYLNSEYNKLCSEKRNDQLKGRFLSLSEEIGSFYGIGEQCSKLSYDEQTIVSNYAQKKLKENNHLIQLNNYGTIECW